MRRLLIIAVASVTAFAFGAAIVRAPKDQPSGKPMLKSAPAPVVKSITLLPPSPAFVIIKKPKPFHIVLVWDAVPDAIAYRIYGGSNSIPYKLMAETTNNFVTISNLLPSGVYEFVFSSLRDDQPRESSYSPVFHWPPSITNYLGFGVSSNKLGIWNTNVVITNPPNPVFCRLLRIPNVFTLQMSLDLKTWMAATNWPATNQPIDFYLHQTHWDNFNGHNFQKPD